MSLPALVAAVLAAAVVLSCVVARRARRTGRVVARLRARQRPEGAWPPVAWVAALEEAGLFPGAAWAEGLLALVAVAVVVTWSAAGPVGVAALAVGVGLVRPLLRRAMVRRRDALVTAALPAAVEAVARSVRAGRSLRQAVDDAARATPGILGRELAEVARRARDGASLSAAVGWWRVAHPAREVRLMAAALELCASAGGAQARALDGVAATIREEQGLRAEVRAQSAQARMSAALIALAPLAFAALTCSVDPESAAFLLRTPTGLACLGIGVGLDVVAVWWMRRLTRAATWSA